MLASSAMESRYPSCHGILLPWPGFLPSLGRSTPHARHPVERLMGSRRSERRRAALRQGALGLAVLDGVLSIVVLAGWALSAESVVSVVPGLATMKVNTALCFGGCAAALLAHGSGRRTLRLTFGAAVVLLAAASGLQDLLGADLGIDQLFLADPFTAEGAPGRMSVATATSFLGLGAAILALDRPVLAQGIALVVGTIPTVAGFGYLYSASALYAVGPFSSIALHTCIGLLLLLASLVWLEPAHGVGAVATAEDDGGRTVRVLVPVLLVSSVAFAGAVGQAERMELFSALFGLATLTALSMQVTVATALGVGLRQSEVDRARQAAVEARQAALAELEEVAARRRAILETMHSGIVTTLADGSIEEANPSACRLLGLGVDELRGRTLSDVGLDVSEGEAELHTGLPSATRLTVTRRPVVGVPGLWMVLLRDVTLQRAAEEARERLLEELLQTNEALEGRLRERDVLLQEVHHRVKNNLQLVSSLLNLQARSLDPGARAVLDVSRSRVRSIALVHQALYQSRDYAGVAFAGYLAKLVPELVQAQSDHIRVQMEVDEVDIPVSAAIPCGLIVHELVTNAVKYAFPDGRSGTITVGLGRDGDQCRLTVADDGVGMMDGGNSGLGRSIVDTLVRQLSGTCTVSSVHGTEFVLVFPLNGTAS